MTPAQILEQAVQHHQAGRFASAASLYRQLLSTNPTDANALNLLGVLAGQQGRPEEAMALIGRAIAAHPAGDFYFNLGEACRAAGHYEQAATAFSQAIGHLPPTPQLFHAHGLVADKLGRTQDAVAAQRRAIELDRKFAPAHDALCTVLMREGRYLEVAEVCRRALALDPLRAPLHAQLGAALNKAGDQPAALAAFVRALQLQPDWPQALINLAEVFNRMGRWRESADAARRATQLEPGRAEAYPFLGYALEQIGQLTAAAEAYRAGLRLNPDECGSLGNLAGALLEMLQFDASIATYRQAVARKPSDPQLHSDLLLALNYSAPADEAALFEEHKIWALRHAAPLAPRHLPARTGSRPDGPLRVGYLSPDLRVHPVSHFIAPLLSGHDRAAVVPIVYCDALNPDEVTRRLRARVAPDAWHDVRKLSDEQLDRQIREDRIDILVDLAGHTGLNRLTVFARKPAPVQVAYLGYPNTTGIPRRIMDYRLTDAYCDPPGITEVLHTEELVRLPDCFLCYSPPTDAPAVALPAIAAERTVTFGSFNAMQKISGPVIELWSRILNGLPGSKLALKNRTLGDSGIRRTVAELFAQHGIKEERLVLIPPLPTLGDHFARYAQVDIGLDPFPYNGTTTTCDALWMGVPVVTLAGKSHRSRVGVSLLNNVGLPELVAQTPEEYVRIAVALAQDLPRRARLRHELRDRMRQSPLTDAAGFVRKVEQAFKRMWD